MAAGMNRAGLVSSQSGDADTFDDSGSGRGAGRVRVENFENSRECCYPTMVKADWYICIVGVTGTASQCLRGFSAKWFIRFCAGLAARMADDCQVTCGWLDKCVFV